MADQEHGAGVILQQLLEQLQGIDIKIIRRLIQHKYIRWLRKQSRQQQTIALTTRQRLDGRSSSLGREQKITEIRHDMFAIAIDLDPVTARRYRFGERGFFIQLLAHLIKVSDLQTTTLTYRSCIWPLLP